MKKIKICGITKESDFLALSQLAVDYLGFIFYEKSPRYISPKTVANFHHPKIKKVGVFVNESSEKIKNIYKEANLDIVQLHGEETFDFCESLGVTYWKSIRVKNKESLEIINSFDKNTIFLLDVFSETQYGGTGENIPKNLIEEALKKTKNIILAGGISEHNIQRFFDKNILGFDINSSVELKPGIKNIEKCSTIINLVRATKEEVSL
jgi:phosphoribosylanthranilate isomerase